MTDFSTMITMVREYYNEPSANFLTDAEIGRWINEGYKRCVGKVENYTKIRTAASLENQQQYDFNYTDVIKITNVRFDDDYLHKLDYRQAVQVYANQSLDSVGDPVSYWEIEKELYLYPKPSANSASVAVGTNVDLTTTIIRVTDTGDFPSQGRLIIDSEIIEYQDTTSSAFLICTRAMEGTTAALHTATVTATWRDIEVKFIANPTELSNGLSPIFEEQYHHIPVEYAAWRAKLKGGNINEAQIWEKLFKEDVLAMKVETRLARGYPVVKDAKIYGIPTK